MDGHEGAVAHGHEHRDVVDVERRLEAGEPAHRPQDGPVPPLAAPAAASTSTVTSAICRAGSPNRRANWLQLAMRIGVFTGPPGARPMKAATEVLTPSSGFCAAGISST